MWPFTDFSTVRKVNRHEEALEKLEREMKAIRGEWDDSYDRLMKLVGRFTKRAQQIEQHEAETVTEQEIPTGSGTGTARLDPISQRILDRRQRMFPVKKEA
jgi:hypothetical protein